MIDRSQALGDSLMRLAAVPLHPPLTREQWIAKFSRISMNSMVAVVPDSEVYSLDANWTLSRVGSFWRADEEYHVFAMENAIKTMIDHRYSRPQMDMVIVTPIWVFRRNDSRAEPVSGDDLVRTAEHNFMRFFDEIYKRWKTNG